jgi:hypothetical protein
MLIPVCSKKIQIAVENFFVRNSSMKYLFSLIELGFALPIREKGTALCTKVLLSQFISFIPFNVE